MHCEQTPTTPPDEGERAIAFASRWNKIVAVGQAVVAASTLNVLVAADTLHNMSDGFGHDAHNAAVASEKAGNLQELERQRKRAGLIICAGAFAVSVASVGQAAFVEQVAEIETLPLIAESASVALAGIAAYKFNKVGASFEGLTHARKHNLLDLKTSAFALAGVAAAAVNPYADNVAAVIVGAVTFTFGARLYKNKVH